MFSVSQDLGCQIVGLMVYARRNSINGFNEGILPQEDVDFHDILKSFPSDTDFFNKKILP